jgi:hypothetical protein
MARLLGKKNGACSCPASGSLYLSRPGSTLVSAVVASGAGRRLRRDSCFEALAGERQRRRWKQVHPFLDPAPVPGSHAPSCDGIDPVRSSRGPVPTIWLHAASTCWALPQRRNRAWPRLSMAREGWRSPNLREVCVRAQPLVLARAWIGGEGLCGGQARWFGNHYGDVANAQPRRSLTSQEPATISRTRSHEGTTRRARGADHNARKKQVLPELSCDSPLGFPTVADCGRGLTSAKMPVCNWLRCCGPSPCSGRSMGASRPGMHDEFFALDHGLQGHPCGCSRPGPRFGQ